MEGYSSARSVLWYLIFTGFVVGYMLVVHINISIVSMVKKHHSRINNASLSSECFNSSTLLIPVDNITIQESETTDELRFDWDEKQQNLILGSLTWFSFVLQIPAGALMQRCGTKLIFGLSNLIPGLLSLFLPFSARLDYKAVVFIRVLMGLFHNLKWPASANLIAKWIPPNDRSKFVTASMGSFVGIALTYPLCGLIISWLDWPAVFYITGVIGVVWFIAWCLLVYETPSQHPRISASEKKYILKSLGSSVSTKKMKIPWKKILFSRPVWIITLAKIGYLWAFITLVIQAPTYFKLIHGWNIRMAGILSGVPHLLTVVLALTISYIADYFLKNDVMTRTNVRKVATGISLIGQGILVLGLAFSGCNSVAAIACFMLATGLSGIMTSGATVATIDIAPNYAGLLSGITNTIAAIPLFLSPIIVGVLTYQNQTVGQWSLVFIITAIMVLVPGILYQLFGTSELQEWNSYSDEKQNCELEKIVSKIPENENSFECKK